MTVAKTPRRLPDCREEVLSLSRPDLTGVIATATEASRRPCAVVMLNAGVLHRVGPNRLYVKLARRLAGDGFLTCRFDLSGIGDSPASSDSQAFSERSSAEIAVVLDHLQACHGVRAFVLLGICLGAELSATFASEDPRVVGCVLINGGLLPEHEIVEAKRSAQARTQARLYRKRLRNWRTYVRVLTFKSDFQKFWRTATRLIARNPARSRSDPGGGSDLPWIFRGGPPTLLLYSEASDAYAIYTHHIAPRLATAGHNKRLDVEIVRGADHVFTLTGSQEKLVEVAAEWVRSLGCDSPLATDHREVGAEEAG